MTSVTTRETSEPALVHASRGLSADGRRAHAVALAVAWIVGALLALGVLHRGWVPHDEGSLGSSALAVSAGELPHRDHVEIYTGGTSYLHALAFALFGESLASLRWMVFLAFVAWIPAVYFVASRFATPALAALATVTAAAWSLPNYPAAVPSWYCLFLATMGVAAVLRFFETRRRRWLVLAGAVGGLSCLAKVVGVTFLAAAGLALLAWEQHGSNNADTPQEEGGRRLGATVMILMAAAVVLTVAVVAPRAGAAGLLHFALPPALLALLVVRGELSRWRKGGGPRFALLASTAVPFAAGVALVTVPFLVPYVATGALGDLAHGLFVAPAARFDHAATPLPPAWTLALGLPVAVLLWVAGRLTEPARHRLALGLVLPGAAVLLAAGSVPAVYRTTFLQARSLVPLVLVAGTVALWAGFRRDGRRAPAVHAVLAVAGLGSLVQFPFAAPVYFLYAAPLGLLALLAVVARQRPGPRPVLTLVLAFHLLFAVAWLNRGYIFWMGIAYQPHPPTVRLELERGGLDVAEDDAREYEALVALLRRHGGGGPVLAFPDSPEVPFLAALPQALDASYDFFEDREARSRRIRSAIERGEVRAIAINHAAQFSDPPDPELLALLRREFPHGAQVRRFEVRWRP